MEVVGVAFSEEVIVEEVEVAVHETQEVSKTVSVMKVLHEMKREEAHLDEAVEVFDEEVALEAGPALDFDRDHQKMEVKNSRAVMETVHQDVVGEEEDVDGDEEVQEEPLSNSPKKAKPQKFQTAQEHNIPLYFFDCCLLIFEFPSKQRRPKL